MPVRKGDDIHPAGEVERPSIRGSDPLGALPEEEIAALDSASQIERAARSGILFQEGHTLSHLYVVASGSFKLVRYSEQGREFIVRLASRGDSFGPFAEPAITAAAARALEASTCLAVPVPAVRRAIERNPSLALRAIQAAERRVREAEVRAARLAFESVPRRLSILLLDATDRRTGLLRFPLNQSELASFIGSSRETVCSVLNQLRRDGIVDTPRGRIRLLDRKRLQEECS